MFKDCFSCGFFLEDLKNKAIIVAAKHQCRMEFSCWNCITLFSNGSCTQKQLDQGKLRINIPAHLGCFLWIWLQELFRKRQSCSNNHKNDTFMQAWNPFIFLLSRIHLKHMRMAQKKKILGSNKKGNQNQYILWSHQRQDQCH